MELFNKAINKEDISKVSSQISSTLESLGIAVSVQPEIYNALQELINGLNIGKKCVKASVNRLSKFFYRLIEIQGLQGFPKCKALRANPANKEFFALSDKLEAEVNAISKSITSPSIHFNAKTAQKWARMIVLLADLLK